MPQDWGVGGWVAPIALGIPHSRRPQTFTRNTLLTLSFTQGDSVFQKCANQGLCLTDFAQKHTHTQKKVEYGRGNKKITRLE